MTLFAVSYCIVVSSCLDNNDHGISDLLNSKDDLGIALSGGGVRAVTLSLGWARSLHLMGILKKARYISSISGGSWLHGELLHM